jgi:crotonobetainyl-CoA:carnitine CoA-transferase CaiB-like acyl-CoA transferase
MARMEPLEIWHAPVQGYAEIVDDPQIRHMQAMVTVPGEGDRHAPITVVNHPVLYDGKRAEVCLPPQRLGAQTGEILKEIGLSQPEIEALARDEVIKLAGPRPTQE